MTSFPSVIEVSNPVFSVVPVVMLLFKLELSVLPVEIVFSSLTFASFALMTLKEQF